VDEGEVTAGVAARAEALVVAAEADRALRGHAGATTERFSNRMLDTTVAWMKAK
jgi:hypothetical protein